MVNRGADEEAVAYRFIAHSALVGFMIIAKSNVYLCCAFTREGLLNRNTLVSLPLTGESILK